METEGKLGEGNYESNRVSKCITMQEGKTSQIRNFKKGLQTTQNMVGEISREKV